MNKYIGILMVLCCALLVSACGTSSNHAMSKSSKPKTTKQAGNTINATLKQIAYEKSVINKHILSKNAPMQIVTHGNASAGTNAIAIVLTNKNNMKSVNVKALWKKVYDFHAKYPNVRILIFTNGGNLLATGTVGSTKLSLIKGSQHQTEGLNQQSKSPYDNARWRKISKDYNKATEQAARRAQKDNQPIINGYKKSLNQKQRY